MEISEEINELAKRVNEEFGGLGEVSMIPLAKEVEDEIGETTREDVMVSDVLQNIAAEDGDNYYDYADTEDLENMLQDIE